MTDDLSDYGHLNATRKQLVERRDASVDDGERSRISILIQNIDNLKRDPNDEKLLEQFARNTADLERYKAGRG